MPRTAAKYYLSSIPTLLGGIHHALPTLLSAALTKQADRLVRLADGTKFHTRGLMDIWVIKETCLDRDYERIGAPIQDGWSVIDVGAGLGDFSVHVARRFPKARVIGFEPFAESYALLKRNIAENGVANVTVYPKAISHDGRPLVLRVIGEAVQHSTSDGGKPAAGEQAVESMTLGAALDAHGLAGCDLIKIDCEGGEFEILLNADRALLGRFRRIALEYHDSATMHNHAELERHLTAAGFTVTIFPNPVHADLGFLYAMRR